MSRLDTTKEHIQQVLDLLDEPKSGKQLTNESGRSSSTISYMTKALCDNGYIKTIGKYKRLHSRTDKVLDDFGFALIKESMKKHRLLNMGTGTPNKEKFDPKETINKQVKSSISCVPGSNGGHMIVNGLDGYHSARPSKSRFEVRVNNSTLNRI